MSPVFGMILIVLRYDQKRGDSEANVRKNSVHHSPSLVMRKVLENLRLFVKDQYNVCEKYVKIASECIYIIAIFMKD